MAIVEIHLQDGFEGDEVVVLMDGREVFSSESVTSQALLGLAETITLEADTAGHEVTVELPRRGVSGNTSVPASERSYVGVTRQGDSLELIVTGDPGPFATGQTIEITLRPESTTTYWLEELRLRRAWSRSDDR